MAFTAEEAAAEYGSVRKDNYLAHTIRDIEARIIREKGKIYQIQTYPSERRNFKCDFFDHGCTIRMPRAIDDMQVREVRVRLAHELGHIIRNMDKLDNPEFLQRKLTNGEKREEEIYAWKFAYFLILEKSRNYEKYDCSEFVYDDRELAATIQGIVKNTDDAVYDELGRVMPFTG